MGLKNKNIECEGNDARDIMKVICDALLTDESGADGLPTGVMIEMPDGSVEPVAFAWYDRQRDMIRLSFESEE